jgi:hypothetical protein
LNAAVHAIKRQFKILAGLFVVLPLFGEAAEKEPVQLLIPWLLKEKAAFREIRFADVILATSGKQVIPMNLDLPDERHVLLQIGEALDEVLRKLNAPGSPAQNVSRINEVSSHFENALHKALNSKPEMSCGFPKTAGGKMQRSGYPDLRLVHQPEGKVYYLDPKLHAKGSRHSSFRTFYFEPGTETNKVNDDARHLVIGIEHQQSEYGWKFLRWELVDLAHFRVRLKAEFEASNRDIYRPEAILSRSAQ